MGEIDFESYRLFCMVAECESFSKASEKLYISQPAVTQAIRKLEENLKGKLFFRMPKGVKLTEEGRRLYEYLKPSVDTMHNAENKFSQYVHLEEGEIKVRTGSALGNVCIYDALIAFSQKYPKIKVMVSSGYVGDSIELLARGDVDLVAVNMPFECDKPNIQIIKCKEIEDCFYVSKEYFEKLKEATNMKEVLEKELIAPTEYSTTGKILKRFLDENGMYYAPKFTISSTNARKYFALKGLGVSFGIKNNIKKELEKGELVELKIMKEPLIRSVGIAIQKSEITSNATLKLVEMIQKI